MIGSSGGWTRRTRRRVFVIVTAGAMGLAVPAWVPRLLATLPAFHVDEVLVDGTRYIRPDEVKRLAALDEGASVWDDPETWEARVREHPMVRDVTVRRRGFRSIEIAVVEKHPVALVATPELVPVNGDGIVLPVDPAAVALDLPMIEGLTGVEDGRIADPGILELAGVLDRLERENAGFVSVISEAGRTPEGDLRFVMLPGADAGLVLLPRSDPVRGLRRVSIALGQVEDPRVERADARFAGQVVLTRAEER